MKKLEFLKKFVLSERYRYKKSVIDLFAIRKTSDLPREEKNAYRVLRNVTGVFFLDKDNNYEPTQIIDAKPNEPLFTFQDRIVIDPSWIPNIDKQTETSIGNLLFNLCCIVPAFGTKMSFILGKSSVSAIEDMIGPKLKDTPKPEEPRHSEYYYVDEYLRFVDSLEYIKGWTQIATIALTKKVITPPPGMTEFKQQLLKKYGDKLSDPVQVALMEKEMAEYDKEYLKDDPTLGKFTSGKMLTTVRKKLFHSLGVNKGFKYSATVEPIINSLHDGIPTDPKGFALVNNDLRVGSYGRGAETINGGVVAKGLLRASNFIKIVQEDCNAKFGLIRNYSPKEIKHLEGRYIKQGTKWILVNKEDLDKYTDKEVEVRSNMYCQSPGVTYCKYCSGENLSRNENGISIGFTELSGVILATSMSAVHTSELQVQKLDINTCFR